MFPPQKYNIFATYARVCVFLYKKGEACAPPRMIFITEVNRYLFSDPSLSAVACMTANYDDKTNWREVQEIRDFFSKVRDSELSDDVKNKVVNFFQNPPDLKTAYEEAKKVKNCPKEIFEGMIRLIVACDGVVSEKEEELLRMWNALM